MAKFRPDQDLVRQLSKLLAETGLTEIEYEANGERIRVARNGAMPQAAATPAATSLDEAPRKDKASESAPAGTVVAPMVGTAYLSSDPAADAFVSLGDQVSKGQTLLIVEAMKVMNQIPSPVAGRVMQILIEDGQPVEYGEPLMVIG